jgi:RNA 3'-terminal phosphate cyclase (ATP)
MAPTADYLAHVFAPTISAFGWHMELECTTPGFYPKGGGRIDAVIEQAHPTPVALTGFPEDHLLEALVVSTLDREDLFARCHDELAKLHEGHSAAFRFERIPKESISEGIALTLVAANGHHRAGFSALGERRRTMEQVAQSAYAEYADWNQRHPGVDEHLADQLAPLAALTPGHSQWTTSRVTDHLRTVLQVIDWFGLAACELDERSGLVQINA